MAEEEYVEHFPESKLTLGKLRRKFESTQNFHKIPEWLKRKQSRGQFRQIKSRPQPTALRLKDGFVAYRVPGQLVNGGLAHAAALEQWVNEFGDRLPREEVEGQGVRCVRDYTYCVKDEEGGAPTLSRDCQDDGEVATKFLESSRLLWDQAREWFPKHHHERVFRDLTRYSMKNGKRRLCGPWTGCSVDVAVENRSAPTQPRRNVTGFLFGMSCLFPFGKFRPGGVILWELEAVVELKEGDLFFVMDHLINYSTARVEGVRHSVVASMDHDMWLWMKKEYGFEDHRLEPLINAQKRYREEGEQRKLPEVKKRRTEEKMMKREKLREKRREQKKRRKEKEKEMEKREGGEEGRGEGGEKAKQELTEVF
jgi:hypothetical protein